MKQNETSKTCRVIRCCGGRDTSRVAIQGKRVSLLWQIETMSGYLYIPNTFLRSSVLNLRRIHSRLTLSCLTVAVRSGRITCWSFRINLSTSTKEIEWEMFIRNQTTIVYEIICEIMLYIRVIFKLYRSPDDTWSFRINLSTSEKEIEWEMFIRNQPTIVYEIICEIMLYSRITFKLT